MYEEFVQCLWSSHTTGELDGDVMPDVVCPAFEHACPGHEVQAVARDVRVGSEERMAIYGQEMDVGVPARTENFLQVMAQTPVSGQGH